jgi:Tol biopolymer transport system component
LTVDVSNLPPAAYNTPYYAQLTGTGGTGPSFYNWTISSGTPPTGVTLAPNGEFSGTPLEDGDFKFTVRVQDNAGNWGEKALSMSVSRKRWLAFRSDRVTAGRHVLYLLDHTKAALPVTDLGTYASAGCSEDIGEFSPDGKKFAFLAARGASCDQKWLYVVDVSTSTVGNALRVDKNTGVYSILGWSPDSKWLAYSEMTNITTFTGNKYLVNMSGNLPGTPVAIETSGGMRNSHRFASPSWFVWLDADYYVHETILSATGTWESKPVTTCRCGGGSITGTHPSGFVQCIVPAKTSAMRVCDIKAGTSTPLVWGYFSYDYTMFVDYYDSATGDILQTGVLKMVATNKPIFSTINLGVRPKALWANTSTTVNALPTSTLNAYRVAVNPGGSGAASSEVADTAGYVNVKYSPDDKWLAWGSTASVALSSPASSTRTIVSGTVPSGGILSADLQFAPNSKVFSFAGQMDTATVNELYVVDVSTGKIGATRKVNGPLDAGTNVGITGFTADSAAVYYQVGKLPTASLFLSSAIAKEPQGIQLATQYTAYRFQP